MDIIQIEIWGSPIPWSAPKITRKGHSFSPHSQKKQIIQWTVKNTYRGELLTGPIALSFIFEMPIPRSFSKKKRKAMVGQFAPVRPDTTNLQKMYEDCLIGIVLKDDNQVCRILSEKIYSEIAKTTIHVCKL